MARSTNPQTAQPRPLDPSVFDVHEYELKNGLRVRLVVDHSVPTISYYTFFRVGSRNERPGITGIAHLFEHMMFNGAAKYGPKEFDRVLESAGGSSNAYTSNDITAYYEDFASDALPTVLDLESDRMRALAITPETLASEREVVKEERRFRVDNDVIGMLDEALGTLVWKAHPYRWPVIGWMADLDAITREDALEFFRTYYAPNNALIVAVGSLDPEHTLRLIEEFYGDIPAGPTAPSVVNAEPEPLGERRGVIHYPSQAPALMIGYGATRARDPDTFVLDVIQHAISVGDSSRLPKRLVFDEELATAVMVDFGWKIDPGVFVLYAEMRPDGEPEKVEEAIYEELANVARDGLTDLELQRAKNGLRAHFLHEIATNNGKAHVIGSYEVLLGDWREAVGTLDKYAAITNDDVKRVAEKYFAPKNRSVVTLVPSSAAEAWPPPARKGRAKPRSTVKRAATAVRAAAKRPAARATARAAEKTTKRSTAPSRTTTTKRAAAPSRTTTKRAAATSGTTTQRVAAPSRTTTKRAAAPSRTATTKRAAAPSRTTATRRAAASSSTTATKRTATGGARSNAARSAASKARTSASASSGTRKAGPASARKTASRKPAGRKPRKPGSK